MQRLAISLAVLLVLPVQAEVYRIVNPDGSVTFTDQPVQGAEKLDLPPVMTYSAPKVRTPAPAGQDTDGSGGQSYSRFVIASPAPETTIRDNAGNVSMVVQVDPSLQVERGHRIQFMVDGVDQGEPVDSTGITFQNVDRGSHTLSARIVAADGTTLETTPPVTVFVHRTTVNAPARQ
jgi:hypothetical protein